MKELLNYKRVQDSLIIDTISSNQQVIPPPKMQVLHKLGEGSYGQVIEENGKAVKITKNVGPYLPYRCTIIEASVAYAVESQYLVKAEDVVVTRDTTRLIMPKASMDLHVFLTEKDSSPKALKRILFQVGLGLASLHNMGVIHGDLKVSNILMFYQEGQWQPKICDYGSCSWYCIAQTQIEVGTYINAAPEVLKENLMTPEADVWAFATILALVLELKHIFMPPHVDINSSWDEVKEQVLKFQQDPEFLEKRIANYETGLKELLRRILKPLPERPNIAQVLADPFFADVAYEEIPIMLSPTEIREATWEDLREIPDEVNYQLARVAISMKSPLNVLVFAKGMVREYPELFLENPQAYASIAIAYAEALCDNLMSLPDNICENLKKFAEVTRLKIRPRSLEPYES
jgi:serine/threonine protein kinase